MYNITNYFNFSDDNLYQQAKSIFIHKFIMGNNVVLGYWKFRGIAQTIRLLLAYTKVEFTEVQYLFEEKDKWFKDAKMSLGFQFPNLPYLTDNDFKLTQSSAIVSYIVEKTGKSELLGKDLQDSGIVNNIIGVLNDTRKDLSALFFDKEYQKSKGAVLEKIRPRLQNLQKLIGEKPFALGYLTYVDFYLSQQLYYFETMFPNEKGSYPFWSRIRHNFESLPEIKAYYDKPNAIKQPFLPPIAAIQPKLNKVKLGYWKIRGLAQVPRLLLAYSGVQFEDYYYVGGQPEWPEQDKKYLGLNFPNIPYLMEGDYNITESTAIQRYIIKRWGRTELLGKNLQERARIQSYLSVFGEIFGNIKSLFWNKDYESVKKEVLGKCTPKLDLLQQSIGQKPFAIGYLTLIDFIIAEDSYYIETVYTPSEFKKWSFITRIRENFNNQPQILAYYKSQKCFKGDVYSPFASIKIAIPQRFK